VLLAFLHSKFLAYFLDILGSVVSYNQNKGITREKRRIYKKGDRLW